MLTINIIGAGALGQTLGHLFVKHQVATILGIVTREASSAEAAIKFIGQGQYYSEVQDLPSAAVTLVTTPDQYIASSASQLAHNQNLRPGTIVLHCSGALSSDCLAVLHKHNIHTASLHPMSSFKHPRLNVSTFSGVPCALEGDEEALETVKELFSAIGGDVYLIAKDKKVLYHVAGVFASNYQIILAQQAKECLRAAGIEDTKAQKILERIMHSVIDNIMHAVEPKDALTGPIQRGDVATIEHHIQGLSDYPYWRNLYLNLGQMTVSYAPIDQSTKNILLNLLSEGSVKS